MSTDNVTGIYKNVLHLSGYQHEMTHFYWVGVGWGSFLRESSGNHVEICNFKLDWKGIEKTLVKQTKRYLFVWHKYFFPFHLYIFFQKNHFSHANSLEGKLMKSNYNNNRVVGQFVKIIVIFLCFGFHFSVIFHFSTVGEV